MHSFRAIVSGLLIAAATILALPTGNNPRSLASVSNNELDTRDFIYIRTPIEVTFGAQVPAEHHAAIKTQFGAHHTSLSHGDLRKAAVNAHIDKGLHVTTGEEHLGEHATLHYHRAGAKNQKNRISQDIHVNRPVRRSPTIEVTFGDQVPAEERPEIKAVVEAHHASLGHDDLGKAAVNAHVHKGWHHSPGERSGAKHATFRFHRAGAKNQKNRIGKGVHVYKPEPAQTRR